MPNLFSGVGKRGSDTRNKEVVLVNMYWDSLIRIKNAMERNYEKVKLPYSRFDSNILDVLVKEGYLESATRKGRGVRRIIDVKLKYDDEGNPAITGINFVSRPSRRMYLGYRDVKRSHQGFGHFILSTPGGVMTDRDVRRKKIGGQILFEIW